MRQAVTTMKADSEPKKEFRWKELIPKEEEKYTAAERAMMLKKMNLMREIEIGEMNTERYRTLWREMMMRIKMPQIIEDIEIASRNFDRALDIKDYRISFLMDEIAEAEDQYQRNVRSHTEIIDRSLRKYKERIERENEIYQINLNKMLDEQNAEVEKINRQQNEEEILLQAIIRNVQRQLNESWNNIRSITLSKIHAFVEDSRNFRRLTAATLEKPLQNFKEDLRRILSDYQDSHIQRKRFFQSSVNQYDIVPETKDRQKYYDAIKEKDEEDQRIIARQVLRTEKLFVEIQKYRDKITMHDATGKKEISGISTEHDFFQNAYWTVKNRFLLEQKKDKDQLKILSIEYNKARKHLENLETKIKRLLTLMQICHKYETQNEKMLPFVDHTDLKLQLPDQTSTSLNWHIFSEIVDLSNFWRRFGAAQITTAKLQLERNKFKMEANYLRGQLNSYIKANDERNNIEQNNNLIVI